MATNNAIDKATALVKIADLMATCTRTIDSAAKYIQVAEKTAQAAQQSSKEDKDVEDMFGDIQ